MREDKHEVAWRVIHEIYHSQMLKTIKKFGFKGSSNIDSISIAASKSLAKNYKINSIVPGLVRVTTIRKCIDKKRQLKKRSIVREEKAESKLRKLSFSSFFRKRSPLVLESDIQTCYKVLKALRKNQFDAWEMHKFLDCPAKEVAILMNKSESNVYGLAHRANEKIKEAIRKNKEVDYDETFAAAIIAILTESKYITYYQNIKNNG